jgi:hypothetical protein
VYSAKGRCDGSSRCRCDTRTGTHIWGGELDRSDVGGDDGLLVTKRFWGGQTSGPPSGPTRFRHTLVAGEEGFLLREEERKRGIRMDGGGPHRRPTTTLTYQEK